MNSPARQSRVAVPPWASSWGVDEYGHWVELEYKGVAQRMRWIDPGRFWMGSPETEVGRFDNEVHHQVQLTEGYWLGDTACTQELWMAVMGWNSSRFREREDESGRRPVEKVSWDDCQEFLGRLNREIPGIELGLPTEAEWEYACRAGTQTPFSFGTDITPDLVNYDGNYPYVGERKGEFREKTVPVKSLPPNAWGLYEMHGNVWEWCLDEYAEYQSGLVVDPLGSAEAAEIGERRRVVRGGSWFDSARDARSACRYWLAPDFRGYYLGFRVARGRRFEPVRPARAEGARGPVEASGAKPTFGPRATGAR